MSSKIVAVLDLIDGNSWHNDEGPNTYRYAIFGGEVFDKKLFNLDLNETLAEVIPTDFEDFDPYLTAVLEGLQDKGWVLDEWGEAIPRIEVEI